MKREIIFLEEAFFLDSFLFSFNLKENYYTIYFEKKRIFHKFNEREDIVPFSSIFN